MAQPNRAGHKVKKDRSPNFPAITFTAALDHTQKIWEQDKKHQVGIEIALKHMGYTKNGLSLRLLSAMRKFGLVEYEGENVRVSDDANAIFLFPRGAQERESRIRQLAMRPPLFNEVLQKFADGLPSDTTLSARLQHDWKFTQGGAEEFVKVLRHSVELVGVDRPVERADTVSEATAMEAAPMPISTAPNVPPASGPAPSAPTSTMSPAMAPQGPREKHSWKLGDGVWAEITISGKLSPKKFEKLKKYVDLLDFDDDDSQEAEAAE